MNIGRNHPSSPRSTASLPQRLRSQQDSTWKQAGQLMEERGIATQDHVLLQENLATHLAVGSASVRSKMERDLSKPYSDSDVSVRLDTMQQSLVENLDQMAVYPSRVYLTGAFAKGTVGGNSTLEGYAVLPGATWQTAFDSFAERRGQAAASNLFPLAAEDAGYNKGMLLVDGSTIAISPDQLAQPGALREIYGNVLADKPSQREHRLGSLDKPLGKAWRSKFNPTELRSRAVGVALSLVGTLAGLPLVGSLVEKTAGLAVVQNHREIGSGV